MMETSFFVSRETLIPTVAPGMALWREKLFVSMSKNATKASEFFQIPTNRVVELGTQSSRDAAACFVRDERHEQTSACATSRSGCWVGAVVYLRFDTFLVPEGDARTRHRGVRRGDDRASAPTSTSHVEGSINGTSGDAS